MHELSIAESIVKTAQCEAQKRNAVKVIAIGLKIGKMTDIVSEALEFGFESIISGTILENAKLNIEHIPIICKCLSCNKDHIIEKYLFICPECESRNLKICSGNELDISYIELEYDD